MRRRLSTHPFLSNKINKILDKIIKFGNVRDLYADMFNRFGYHPEDSIDHQTNFALFCRYSSKYMTPFQKEYIMAGANKKGTLEEQFNYAVCLENGFGMEPNIPKSLDIYFKLADKNYRKAYFYLGVLYIMGDVLKQNIQLAIKYLRRDVQNSNDDF